MGGDGGSGSGDGGSGSGDGGSGASRWSWMEEDKLQVKVDTCGCTNTGESPSNANGCAVCKACWGGDVDTPDEEQVCMATGSGGSTGWGAAGVSFGVATTAATFIASRIFA